MGGWVVLIFLKCPKVSEQNQNFMQYIIVEGSRLNHLPHLPASPFTLISHLIYPFNTYINFDAVFYANYLHRCERHVNAGRDEARVVGQQLDQLGRRRTLRRRLAPAGFQKSFSAKTDSYHRPLVPSSFRLHICT